MPSNIQLNQAGEPVSLANPLPVVTSTAAIPGATTPATALAAAKVAAIDAAGDRVETPSYLDAGTADERLNAVVVSSASLALSYTETFTYAGSAGAYRIATRTRS